MAKYGKRGSEQKKCANPQCECNATTGEYCSEQCRNASAGQVQCNCGHKDCR